MTGIMGLLLIINLQLFSANALAPIIDTNWAWNSNTYVASEALVDVDGDGMVEIVSGGYFSDGTRYISQLVVRNSLTLAVENVMNWDWGGDTIITSISVGNVDADPEIEIVTAGYYWNGLMNRAVVIVWTGATLTFEREVNWDWGDNTEVWAVGIGDVDNDASVEIITGGSIVVGANTNAQLVVYDGATLAHEADINWRWGTVKDEITCLAIGDVDATSDIEIVTGGIYTNDGTNFNAQLVVWNKSVGLTPKVVTGWIWGTDAEVLSMAIGNVDADPQNEIVTGGVYVDIKQFSQIIVWTGSTLVAEKTVAWSPIDPAAQGNTIFSMALGNVDIDPGLEIVTAGTTTEVVRGRLAELKVWNSTQLTEEFATAWQWGTDSIAFAVTTGDLGGTTAQEIVTGGAWFDGTRYRAQIIVWQ